MRQWRVGTWSMGTALIAMGVLLLAVQFGGISWLDQGMVWWPLLFVLIGVEIVIYLWRSKTEQPVLRYDLFSIIIVALLGGCCLIFTSVSATGLMDEIRGAIGSKEVRVEAAQVSEEVGAAVKRIVVQGENYWNGSLLIDADSSGSNQVQAFGACRYDIGRDEKAPALLDLVDTHMAGDALYVTVKQPVEQGPGAFAASSPSCQLTVVLPSEKKVELTQSVRGFMPHDRKLPAGWRMVL
ncbi:LiaI-LiaF-like domain-containing protein [Paenibacillus montanisoli]|uniref:LiaI-LiaF-like transmembrane region domain-containing protein n=1 Tax=Paenibacillus montanisoli TaxID=2081970 RepID=A0A328U1Q6_9BACL|nr:DUF5668 domain-containing protein [Paenibacillus montanisoli]RAP73944.1 hypothetical protein DL346_22970 [Paenibacillus montanisoli]